MGLGASSTLAVSASAEGSSYLRGSGSSSSSLPEGWTHHVDTNKTGKTFYHNMEQKKSVWEINQDDRALKNNKKSKKVKNKKNIFIASGSGSGSGSAFSFSSGDSASATSSDAPVITVPDAPVKPSDGGDVTPVKPSDGGDVTPVKPSDGGDVTPVKPSEGPDPTPVPEGPDPTPVPEGPDPTPVGVAPPVQPDPEVTQFRLLRYLKDWWYGPEFGPKNKPAHGPENKPAVQSGNLRNSGI